MHLAFIGFLLFSALFIVDARPPLARPQPRQQYPIYQSSPRYQECSGSQNHMCKREYSWSKERAWDCVNIFTDSKNCGGCLRPMYEGQARGRDCTIIPGQKEVTCDRGSCQVQGCHSGWKLSADQHSCHEEYDEGD